jgi:hypothetical protein
MGCTNLNSIIKSRNCRDVTANNFKCKIHFFLQDKTMYAKNLYFLSVFMHKLMIMCEKERPKEHISTVSYFV